MRNHFAMLTFIALGLVAASASAQDGPRNVILYVVDDQGTNDAGCYGNPIIRTPGLDTLAENGTRMNYAYATTPSCSSSRSVILSGRHNHDNGMYGLMHSYHHFSSRDNLRTLPVIMGEAGYRTLSAGKYHLAPKEVYAFDEYARLRAPSNIPDSVKSLLADESGKPFFLYFCTTEPHRPFRREGSHAIDPADVIVPDYLPDTPASRRELARYYMSVERADSGLVQLIHMLKETGHWDDTLIIYLSDNGIAFPGAKTTLYEPGVRLPFVMRNPYQMDLGGESNAMFTYTSVTPTILEYAGIEFNADDFQGRSILQAAATENPPGWDEVFLSHTLHEVTMYYPMRVVRDQRYKLIWNLAHGLPFPFASDLYGSETWQDVLESDMKVYGKRTVDAYLHRPRFELYDLQNDPNEIRNLAGDPDSAPLLADMQARLKNHQELTKDPWILKWTRE